MDRNPFVLTRNLFIRALISTLFFFNPLALSSSFQIAELTQTPEERELFNTLPGEAQDGGILDATNPMELMNRLRRATAMDNATPPSDAIDQALQALDRKQLNENPIDQP